MARLDGVLMWGEWVLFERIDTSMNHEPNPVRRPSYVKRVVWAIFGVVAVLIVVLVINDGPSRRSPLLDQARLEVKVLEIGLLSYEKEYGKPLTGRPAEMVRALMGSNPKAIMFSDINYEHMSPEDVLLDPWKQPYHLDTTMPGQPRVYSSGPNRRDERGAVGSDDIVSWR